MPSEGSTTDVFGGVFRGGASVAAGDIDGDGDEEIILGAGRGGGPHVEIYRPDGRQVGSFFVFKRSLHAGLSVAAGDLDGDHQAEIIVGPRGDYAPEIQIYDDHGRRQASWLAFEASYTGGIEVAVLRAEGDRAGMILVASGSGRDQEVRAFSPTGQLLFQDWYPHGRNPGHGLDIAATDSSVFHEPVLVSVPGVGEKPLVLVHGLYSGRLLASWLAYDQRVKTGLSVAAADGTVVTGPGRRGGPEVRIFSVRGVLDRAYRVFEPTYFGGLEVGLLRRGGRLESVATPSGKPSHWLHPKMDKAIVIDLSEQQLYLLEGDRVISVRSVSTGQWSTPTPVGSFRTKNKIGVAYSRRYGLYMEYWMAFTPDGAYGLHALPYWLLRNGQKHYEGTNHLGTPVSHGCIRQRLEDARSLYDWAPIGTTVIVRP